MGNVKEHYDTLLASCYTWSRGGAESNFQRNRRFFDVYGIRPTLSGAAVDLGAGSGFQSIPLARAGFRVIAVDLSRELLGELESYAEGLSIVTVDDNLLNFSRHTPADVELVVCMGDTITHLGSLEDVEHLLHDAFRALEGGGRLILGYRDLTPELEGLDRFILVRSDRERIFTCFLEYEKQYVTVHDIVHEKSAGQWEMKKSCFRKLRLPLQQVEAFVLKAGFKIEEILTDSGMTVLIARKPAG